MKRVSFLDEVGELLIIAGDVLLRSGAETYRVEETLSRIGKAYTNGEVEIFATTTGFMVSLEDDKGNNCTRVKRVKNRDIDLEKIILINDISRKIAGSGLGLTEAQKYINQVHCQGDRYSPVLKVLAHGIASGCYAYVFGGKLEEMAVALGIGMIVNIILRLFNKRVNRIFTVFLGGFGVALLALLAFTLLKVNLNAIIMGSIMLFVPGVAITNSVRDALWEDYLSAASRGLEALLIALSVAAGVSMVLGLWLKYII